MGTRQSVAATVLGIFAEQFGRGNISESTSIADLVSDSLDAAELVIEFEEEFDMNILDAEMGGYENSTIKDVIDAICRHLSIVV